MCTNIAIELKEMYRQCITFDFNHNSFIINFTKNEWSSFIAKKRFNFTPRFKSINTIKGWVDPFHIKING